MLHLLLYLVAAAASAHSSSVSVLSPLSGQLPQIARVDQAFSWPISLQTFASTNGALTYTPSTMPSWLSFDTSSMSFHGTPASGDQGNVEIKLTAHDSSSSASSEFTLCVTQDPAPTLRLPVAQQFYSSNPSLSSVFLLAPNSAIATDNPALRVPHAWSFSVGFESSTFETAGNVYYGALQANGSALPEWIDFNPQTITFNGVAPKNSTVSSPYTVSLALHASDQKGGYTAASLPFDLIVATHELSLDSSLPTINFTSATAFNVSLGSPADFFGILVDGKPIQPSDVNSLSIDTSQFKWLNYDNGGRTLSGNPPSDLQMSSHSPLPVTIETTFNQSIFTNVSLAMFPSYFTSSDLPPILSGNGGEIHFSLAQYVSNKTSGGVDVTAAFNPTEIEQYLRYDSGSSQLTGTLPANLSSINSSRITVTFTAYSHFTHSTSHANLPISLSPSDYNNKGIGHGHTALSGSHTKLVLALGIAFGVIGGLCAAGALLAALRRCARVQDTAITGEEGRNAWTDSEKKWYGIGVDGLPSNSRNAIELGSPPSRRPYGDLGLGLQRILTRTNSNAASNPNSPNTKLTSPGVISKGEFFGRIKETVRNASDKYTRARPRPLIRPTIGKPILLPSGPRTTVDGLPFDGQAYGSIIGSASNPFEDNGLRSYAGSVLDSPSSSTGEYSIPRRRADFAPPRSPALVHFEDTQLARKTSSGSNGSLASDSSSKTHATEAVVRTASRATSVRSGKSTTGISIQPLGPESAGPAVARPRLVAFTSASRVPVPALAVKSASVGSDGSEQSLATTKRVASQSAKVFKGVLPDDNESKDIKDSGSADELSVSMHYVQTLGGDERADSSSGALQANQSTPTISTNVRSSFSSLESSHQGHGTTGGKDATRMLVRAGQRFKFRVPLALERPSSPLSPSYRKEPRLEAKLMSGEALPKFLQVDLKGGRRKGSVEFYGVPGAKDTGELNVCVYTAGDEVPVARVIVEVVGKR